MRKFSGTIALTTSFVNGVTQGRLSHAFCRAGSFQAWQHLANCTSVFLYSLSKQQRSKTSRRSSSTRRAGCMLPRVERGGSWTVRGVARCCLGRYGPLRPMGTFVVRLRGESQPNSHSRSSSPRSPARRVRVGPRVLTSGRVIPWAKIITHSHACQGFDDKC